VVRASLGSRTYTCTLAEGCASRVSTSHCTAPPNSDRFWQNCSQGNSFSKADDALLAAGFALLAVLLAAGGSGAVVLAGGADCVVGGTGLLAAAPGTVLGRFSTACSEGKLSSDEAGTTTGAGLGGGAGTGSGAGAGITQPASRQSSTQQTIRQRD